MKNLFNVKSSDIIITIIIFIIYAQWCKNAKGLKTEAKNTCLARCRVLLLLL